MKYVSTRGISSEVDFIKACLNGLAPDGGLYVPKVYPKIAPASIEESFTSIATRIISAMAGNSIEEDVIESLCRRAFDSFHHKEVTPLTDLGTKCRLLELYHGPTLAFKDVAMQFIAQLFDYILEQRQQRLTVICATSGDTGGAAAAAFAKSKNVSLVILHPHNRISSVQRKFMTCWDADNVLNLAVESDFDSCQGIVKSLFEDRQFAKRTNLSGVNSINWARIAAQMTYYAYASARVSWDDQLRFIVPTGNFGDAFAGYVARRTGMVPENTAFLCAVNENKVLEEAMHQGKLHRVPAVATNSPAMDIAVPSNFERFLFEFSHRDKRFVQKFYRDLKTDNIGAIDTIIQIRIKLSGFHFQSINQAKTIDEIKEVYKETNRILCPHTAVATATLDKIKIRGTNIVLATAHPSKFPEAVKQAIGTSVEVPSEHSLQLQIPEEFHVVDNALPIIREKVESVT